MALYRAMPLDALWIGEMKTVQLGGKPILLIRLESGIHAYEDRCRHLGVRLSRGKLQGSVLTCSAHHWSYDAASGLGINPATACLRSYPVSLVEGIICVEVPNG